MSVPFCLAIPLKLPIPLRGVKKFRPRDRGLDDGGNKSGSRLSTPVETWEFELDGTRPFAERRRLVSGEIERMIDVAGGWPSCC